MKNKRTKSRLTQRQEISIIRLNDSAKKEYLRKIALYKDVQSVVDNFFGFPIFGMFHRPIYYPLFAPIPIRTFLSRKVFK